MKTRVVFSLALLATAGVFRVPVVGSLARRLGFIRVHRGTSEASAALDEAAVNEEAIVVAEVQ